jgi:hypothetical protein
MKVHRVSRSRSHDRILVVEAGQVMCPLQGVVDLERCWVCPAYDGLSGGHVEGVVCRASLTELAFGIRPAVR